MAMAMARMKERLEELEQLDQRERQAVIAEFDDESVSART
jgi:hypothetical protein